MALKTSEIKNVIESMWNRVERVEHRISELEGRKCAVTQLQENKESLHDLCDFIWGTSMRIIGIPEEEGGG